MESFKAALAFMPPLIWGMWSNVDCLEKGTTGGFIQKL